MKEEKILKEEKVKDLNENEVALKKTEAKKEEAIKKEEIRKEAIKEKDLIKEEILKEKEVLFNKPSNTFAKKYPNLVLKNVEGKVMDEEDYFYGGTAPKTFNQVCGFPAEREDLIEVFNKVFKPSENFLFYKSSIKELYVIIVPLKNATTVGADNDSPEGDFQKHSISFLSEGSVNLDTLKIKLQRILTFVKFTDR